MKKVFTLIAFMLAIVYMQATAQERTITGKIISSLDQQGIPGANVVVVGTTIGVSTDIDGNYSLKIPATAKQIHFSAIGMKPKTVDITAENKIDVVLDADVLKLDEVVVTANAIKREKRSLGYATSQIKSDDLTQGENSNLIGALQGKVAGVNVTSLSGAPGSSQRIVIRGGSSLTGNNQALLVVDGVPMDNGNFRTSIPDGGNQGDDLNNQVDYGNRGNDINPDDIESISILKGPAAAALYGSSASNGAIMITTKSGRRTAVGGKSKLDVSFHSKVTFSDILKTPDFQNQYGQGDLDNTIDDRRENFSWGLPFDGKLRPWGQEINGQMQVKPYSAIPDNVKDFFNTGVAYTNNLSFSGGTEKNSYFLSFSALNSKGIVPTTTYDKYNIRFNGSSELSNNFSTSISLNYSNISSNNAVGGQQQSVYDQIVQTPRDIPIVDGKDLANPYNSYNDITGTYGFYAGYTLNPYFLLNNTKNINSVDRIIGSTTITYNNFGWLTITDRLGGDIYGDRRYESWKKYDYAPMDESGLYNSDINGHFYQGKYSQDIYNLTSYNNDLMVTGKRQLTNKISGTLLLGQNIRQYELNNVYAQTNDQGGLIQDGFFNLTNSNGSPYTNNSTNLKRNVGYYASLDLAYSNFLFLGLTGRQDKSSTLPTNNNTYFYPSANASFVFSEFFKSKLKDSIFTYGKIRVSYAKVGNDAPAYATANYYNATNIQSGFGSTVFPLNSVPGFTVYDQFKNPDLKPEFTTASEIGTELGFFQDRISVDFSYYQNSSTNQIFGLPVPNSNGYDSQIKNGGEVRNTGIELALRGIVMNTKAGFKWELYGTYTKNTSKVISLEGGVSQLLLGGFGGMGIYAQVGQPYGSFYAVDLQTDPQGHVIVDPNTGRPLKTTNQVYVGNNQPKFMASWGTNVSYKGFTLGVLFDTKQGGKFFSRTKSIMDFVGTAQETTVNGRADYVWPNSVVEVSPGVYATNDKTFHPYTYWTNDLNTIPGQHVIDASYVKLREISLSYQFPVKWISKTPFGSASLGVFGNNLFIWTPAVNQYSDPEQNSSGASNAQGFEYSPNPSQRNYGVDLKVTF